MKLARAFLILLVMAWGWTAAARPPTGYVEGEVIVTFKTSENLEAAQKALSRHALVFAKHFDLLSARRGKQMGLVREPSRTTAQLIEELKADPSVEVAEPNYLRWPNAQPNDPLFPFLWSFQNTGQNVDGISGTSGDDIKFTGAWNLARPSASQVVVGVIDTGVAYTHPDLAPNMWTNPGEIQGNGADDDHDGYVDDYYGYNFANGNSNPSDSGYHGTHVAGTIAAAGNNQAGVIGVDYQAKIMALRASSNGTDLTTSAIISALQYATMMKGRGVNLVALNASYGGGGYSSAESAAIQAAGNAGIIFCAAAGNESANNNTTLTYPASYRLSNMIVVAASDQNDALASFSNYGSTTVDLAAPGVNILSAAPSGQGGIVSLQVKGSSYSADTLTYSGTTSGLTGAVYDCGIGNTGDFPAGVNGNIALIQRGNLNFSVKVTNAMAAGARAAIIYNNVSGNFAGTLGSSGNWIPSVSISQADGLSIKAGLPATGVMVVGSDYQYLEGTSMATPHVTGAVAFAAMNFPTESVSQRIQRILTHVDVKAGLQGKVATGGRLNLQRIVDTDGNGLPDWWESTYFNQSSGVDPNGDLDHDGMTNGNEFLSGTDPSNGNSVFKVSSFAKDSSGIGFTVTWTSVPGKTYQVTYSNSPSGPWLTDLAGSTLTAGSGEATLSYTDTTAGTQDKRFYRVQLVTQ